jgi:hypothetical protein
MKRQQRSTVTLVVLVVAVAGCTATQIALPPDLFGAELPGFWKGLWHGFIAPVTFIVSLFSDEVRVYAFPNVGRWYDFGFMLGIGGFSGGLFAGSRGGTPSIKP